MTRPPSKRPGRPGAERQVRGRRENASEEEAVMASQPVPFASSCRILAAVILAVSFVTAGCATRHVAFTRGIRTYYELGSDDLKNLQYYVSGDITLQRVFVREAGEVSKGHTLVAKESGLVEQVIIRAGTPGVATEVGDTYLAVSFEPGASLMFGSPAGDRDPDRAYKLLANRWTATYGEIDYGGKTFYAVEGSRGAYLVVTLESLDAVKAKKTVLPGMTFPSK